MPAHVFISHSSKDRQVARKICAAVEERGFTCWVADRDVGPGENFQEAIVRAIRAARVMLLVFTANANESAEVKKELALASRRNVAVIPIRVERVEPSEAFDYEFATRQWIELLEDWDHEFKRLMQSIESIVGVPATPAKPVVPPTPVEILPPQVSPTPVPDSSPTGKPAIPDSRVPDAEPSPRSDDPKRVEGQGDQSWALAAVMTIGTISTVLAVLLGSDHTVSAALRSLSSVLVPAVAVASLVAVTLGLWLLSASESASFDEALNRSLVAIGLIVLIWIIFGYSITMTGGSDFIGGFSKAFLVSVTADSWASTNTVGHMISELSYVILQGCVAAITSILAIAVLGKRMRFAALAWFLPLWAVLVYFPLLHMVFYWAGPDAISDASNALTAASGTSKAAAQAKLDIVNADAGWLYKKGTLDYAGGTVIAMNAGVAGLIGFFFLDDAKTGRQGNTRTETGLTALGVSLIWLAWFGLNAASYMDFGDPVTKIAMANCFAATGAAAAAGMMADWAVRGQLSQRGVLHGALAGIVAVTPASAFAGTLGAAILGACAGAMTVVSVQAGRALVHTALPEMALICLLNGTLGMLATGILASPALGGTGIMDYTTGKIADYDLPAQMISQFWGVCTTLLWAGIGSAIVYKIVDVVIGLRPAAR